MKIYYKTLKNSNIFYNYLLYNHNISLCAVIRVDKFER